LKNKFWFFFFFFFVFLKNKKGYIAILFYIYAIFNLKDIANRVLILEDYVYFFSF